MGLFSISRSSTWIITHIKPNKMIRLHNITKCTQIKSENFFLFYENPLFYENAMLFRSVPEKPSAIIVYDAIFWAKFLLMQLRYAVGCQIERRRHFYSAILMVLEVRTKHVTCRLHFRGYFQICSNTKTAKNTPRNVMKLSFRDSITSNDRGG